MRNSSISTNCKSIYKLNNFLPNRVFSIPLVFTGHWKTTVAQTSQSFMFYWKAPLQLFREKGAPLGMLLMQPDPVCNSGTLMTHCNNSVMIREAAWAAPHNVCGRHAKELRVPLALILIAHFNTQNIPFSWFILLPPGRTTQTCFRITLSRDYKRTLNDGFQCLTAFTVSWFSKEVRCLLDSSNWKGGLLVKCTKIKSSKNQTNVDISEPPGGGGSLSDPLILQPHVLLLN